MFERLNIFTKKTLNTYLERLKNSFKVTESVNGRGEI